MWRRHRHYHRTYIMAFGMMIIAFAVESLRESVHLFKHSAGVVTPNKNETHFHLYGDLNGVVCNPSHTVYFISLTILSYSKCEHFFSSTLNLSSTYFLTHSLSVCLSILSILANSSLSYHIEIQKCMLSIRVCLFT